MTRASRLVYRCKLISGPCLAVGAGGIRRRLAWWRLGLAGSRFIWSLSGHTISHLAPRYNRYGGNVRLLASQCSQDKVNYLPTLLAIG